MSSNHHGRRLRRPGHATVIAYVALFLAFTTGGAYAAAKIGAAQIKNNAIQSRHIANGQVRNPDLRALSVTNSKLGPDAVTGDKVKDASLGGHDLTESTVTNREIADDAVTGAKAADDSLTGSDVNESTLGQVPDSSRLAGRAPGSFLGSSVYKRETANNPGTRLGDNSNVKSLACLPGDVMLSGGVANVNANSDLLETFPSPGTTNGWTARLFDNGATDNFSVVILCIDQ